MSTARVASGAFVLVCCFAFASCEPIEPRPSTTAPINSCADFPCERYELDRPNVKLQCPAPVGRCVFPSQRPEGKFFLVIHAPDTASYGAGLTFVIAGEELDPTTNADPTIVKAPCRGTPLAPICVSLPNLTTMTSYYRVLAKAATDVGFPLALGPETSIPVRVVYDLVGTAEPQIVDVDPLPLDVFFALPRRVGDELQNVRALPYGRFRREVYPQPPWDGWFPPNAKVFDVKTPTFVDDFRLGSIQQPLDDVSGASRTATVTRAEGLENWRVWLNNRSEGRRISTLRTLPKGDHATVRLDTSGERIESNTDAIVAPPEGAIGFPRLVTDLPGGSGLTNLRYPELPPPVAFSGQVTGKSREGVLVGFAARVTFETLPGDLLLARSGTDPLLKYTTTAATDEAGRFSTVVPPGSYTVRVEPAEGTGFANKIVKRKVDPTTSFELFEVDPKTRVRGRAVLTDDRPLSDAEVIATPTEPNPAAFRPRVGRARTDIDGNFEMALDQGSYLFAVIPEPGTGFPRMNARHPIPPNETTLPLMRVPPPIRFAFTLRDARTVNPTPIARAIVRVFGESAPQAGTFVELGSAMSDPQGLVEILLAPQAR
jgi:hypothetical protein